MSLDLNFLLMNKYGESGDILTTPASPVVEYEEDLLKLVETLIKVVDFYEAAGVSANQTKSLFRHNTDKICGKPEGTNSIPAVFIMINSDQKPEPIINPAIIENSEEIAFLVEGCLSFPGLFFPVKRAKTAKVRYNTLAGTLVERELSSGETRIFLHEYDHLLGKTYFDRISPTNRDIQRKEIAKLKRKLIWDNDDALIALSSKEITITEEKEENNGGL